MKVTIAVLKESQQALTALANTPINAKVSYRVSKSLNKIQSILNGTEDWRINTLKKLGKLDPKDNQYKFDPPELKQDWENLYADEQQRMVEIDIPYITLEELGDTKLAPAIFMGLEKLGVISELKVVPTKLDA